MTANLQMTRKQAADLMNVSERSVYDAAKLHKTGRQDLCEAVTDGTLSLHRALILAGVKTKPGRLATLQAAWKGATECERSAFIEWLQGASL